MIEFEPPPATILEEDDDIISQELLQKTNENLTLGETKDALTEKITELFHICDEEKKGYVVKADLYRLQDELGLDEKDIDYAFEQLDTNNDSYLSIEEFTTGFGLFIGVQKPNGNIQQQNGVDENSRDNDQCEIKIDFSFQVFNLIDKDDKGHITKQDLLDASETLEIDSSQIDFLYSRMRRTTEIIYFEDFVNNIGSLIALSPALQEIKEQENDKMKTSEKRNIIARVFNMDLTGYDEDAVEQLLHEQATILFKRCDHDNKNYVTLDDLLNLSSELDLSEEQVTEAFSRLNVRKKDYLTLREFVNGFGLFLGIEQTENGNRDITTDELEKAIDLFNACDVHNRGNVSLYDLKQLTASFGLSEDQISSIFNELDADGNGFITLNEFVTGFSSFISLMNQNDESPDEFLSDSTEKNNKKNEGESEKIFDDIYFMDSSSLERNADTPSPIHSRLESSNNMNGAIQRRNPRSELGRSDSEQSNRSERRFITRQMSLRYESGMGEVDEMITSLEEEFGSSVSKDQLTELWNSVNSSGDSSAALKFESFLSMVYSEIRNAKQEAKHLEDVLEKKSQTHTEEIKKIYDEMEIQMQTEKMKQKQQLAEKENMLREDLMSELEEKEKQVEKFMQRENALRNRLETIKEQEMTLKNQNSKLQKENSQLEDKLNDSMTSMDILKSNLQHMEEQTTAEKKETLRAAVQATQGYQSEHENLVKQLDLLRTMNQKLRDERDTLESSLHTRSKDGFVPAADIHSTVSNTKKPVTRLGSNLGNYVHAHGERTSSTPNHSPLKKQESVLSNYFGPSCGDVEQIPAFDHKDFEQIPAFDHKDLSSIVETDNGIIEMDTLKQNEHLLDENENEEQTEPPSLPPSSPRHPPDGMIHDEERFSDTLSSASSIIPPPETPSRVYKVVFVGDSGVGKSSFIYRFCFDEFQKNFSATIGVDFQVKIIKVKRQWVALQLWDTAGQERFRSITKQYFRRADGVIIMFDLTSEESFLNVKSWMINVEEGAEPDCQIMVIGNKKDVCEENSEKRKVKTEYAENVAKQYNATYEEVSALSGHGVLDAMNGFALRMSSNEDDILQKSNIFLKPKDQESEATPKKKCC